MNSECMKRLYALPSDEERAPDRSFAYAGISVPTTLIERILDSDTSRKGSNQGMPASSPGQAF
jgi:hypothetical protein